jgi:hypothetical protein
LVILENYGQSTICGRFLPRFLLTGSFRLFVMCSIRHVLDMTPDLFFSAAEFLQALLDFLDVRAAGLLLLRMCRRTVPWGYA